MAEVTFKLASVSSLVRKVTHQLSQGVMCKTALWIASSKINKKTDEHFQSYSIHAATSVTGRSCVQPPGLCKWKTASVTACLKTSETALDGMATQKTITRRYGSSMWFRCGHFKTNVHRWTIKKGGLLSGKQDGLCESRAVNLLKWDPRVPALRRSRRAGRM